MAIWDSTTGEIAHHELPAKPASEVFKLAEAAEKKAAKLDLNTFLDSVRATRLEITGTTPSSTTSAPTRRPGPDPGHHPAARGRRMSQPRADHPHRSRRRPHRVPVLRQMDLPCHPLLQGGPGHPGRHDPLPAAARHL